jgi:cell wall-associated NlpC family hydrolase
MAVLLTTVLVPGTANADPDRVREVAAKVEALEHQAEAAAERWNDARIAVTDAQRELDKLNDLVAEREEQLAAVQKTVGAIAATTYQAGGLDSSLQLLLADHPDQFLAQASSLDNVARGQGEVMVQAAAAKQQLTNDKLAAEQKKVALDEAKAAADAEKKSADGKLAEATALLNTLKAEERARLAAEEQRRADAAAAAAAAAAERVTQTTTPTRTTSRSSSSSSSSSSAPAPAPAPAASGKASVAVQAALSRVGMRYVYGATGPNAFDCSGLTSWAWAKAGKSLPHSSKAQYSSGRKISKSQLQPGDLVFYYSPISHVGMYIGGGKIVHAANPRTGVNIAGLNSMPYTGAVRP